MKTVIQRVQHASVTVDQQVVGAITQGLLVLIGVEKGDNQTNADKLIKKLLAIRLFADAEDKMNLSVKDINGGLLLVSQFTLAAETGKGTRPGFSNAAAPDQARQLYDYIVDQCQQQHPQVASGRFAADMKVDLLNDGPATFILET